MLPLPAFVNPLLNVGYNSAYTRERMHIETPPSAALALPVWEMAEAETIR